MQVALIMSALASPINQSEYARIFATFAGQDTQALMVSEAPENLTHRRTIVDLAGNGNLLAVYPRIHG
jgi:hypothetical protein